MPNSKNYKQNLPTTFSGQRTLKRVLVDEQYVIKSEVKVVGPGAPSSENFYNFGLDLDREFVELHFYTPETNNLVFSTAIPLREETENGYFHLTNISNEDNLLKLYINYWTPGAGPVFENDSCGVPTSEHGDNPNYWFNTESLQEKYLYGLPAGTYDVVFNFFADELGSYYDSKDSENFKGEWRIKNISTSKKELILHARPKNADGTVSGYEDDISDVIWRDFEQFLMVSMHSSDFKIMWENFLNTSNNLSDDIEKYLSPRQLQHARDYWNPTDDGYQQADSVTIEGSSPVTRIFPNEKMKNYLNHLLIHIYWEVVQYFNDEVIGEPFRKNTPTFNDGDNTWVNELPYPLGGNRYRIQWNRFWPKVMTRIIEELSADHSGATIIKNDSGPIPFVVNS